MALKRSTSVHQGKLDATGNDSATAASSTSGNLGFVPQTKHSIKIKGFFSIKNGVEFTSPRSDELISNHWIRLSFDMKNYADRGGITPCEIFIIFHIMRHPNPVMFFFIHSMYLLIE